MAKDIAKRPRISHPASAFGDFRREFDDLIESFFGDRSLPFGGGSLAPAGAEKLVPSIDIKENDKSIELTAELPGMAEEDVDVSVLDEMLIIRGEKRQEKSTSEENYHVTERRYGSFERQISIPDRVDVDKVAANFDKGVLHVTMPKRKEAKASSRKIKVGAKK